MMSGLQHLLGKLAEEGTEVAQIALKTAQFGMYEVCTGQPHTNVERVHQELDDLMGIIEMLNERYGFDYIPNPERIAAKKVKVDKFLAYSQSLGMVATPINMESAQ